MKKVTSLMEMTVQIIGEKRNIKMVLGRAKFMGYQARV